MKKRLKIIWYTLFILLLIIDFVFILWSVGIAESERWPRELEEYYGCGQESQFERAICLGWDTQKAIIQWVWERILP